MQETDRLERLQAAQACRNLAGKMLYYSASGRQEDVQALWVQGVDAPRWSEGPMPVDVCVRALDTEFLTVLEPGDRAVGFWISPGSVTKPARPGRESSVDWLWTELRFTFQKTQNGWRIASVTEIPLFQAGYTGENLVEAPYSPPDFPALPAKSGSAGGPLDRLESAQACRNLMGRYCRLGAAGADVSAVWACLESDLLLCPAGEFTGAAARRSPEAGVLYELDTEILEIAEDGMTAAGCWNSPGYGDGKWYWGKFEVIFCRMPGGWRIHKIAYYPVFKTALDTPWTHSAGYADTPALRRLDCRWAADKIHPAGRPEAPAAEGPYTRLSVEEGAS